MARPWHRKRKASLSSLADRNDLELICLCFRHDERFVDIQSTRDYEMYVHLRSPFVHAAQSINTLMQSNPPLLVALVGAFYPRGYGFSHGPDA